MKGGKIVVTRILPPEAQALLEASRTRGEFLDVYQWQEDGPIPRQELKRVLPGAIGLLCLITDRIDVELLDCAGPSLRVVSTLSVGLDHIDVEECKRRGIRVGNTPDVLTDATADLTVAALLALLRRIPEAAECVRTGKVTLPSTI